jgi:adenylate kinase
MEEEDEKEMAADKELWEDLKDAYRLNNNQYPDEQIIAFVKEELNSMRCRNQGFVLDGYPCFFEQAADLLKGMFQVFFEFKNSNVFNVLASK